jgi:hypothetical protein
VLLPSRLLTYRTFETCVHPTDCHLHRIDNLNNGAYGCLCERSCMDGLMVPVQTRIAARSTDPMLTILWGWTGYGSLGTHVEQGLSTPI